MQIAREGETIVSAIMPNAHATAHPMIDFPGQLNRLAFGWRFQPKNRPILVQRESMTMQQQSHTRYQRCSRCIDSPWSIVNKDEVVVLEIPSF